MSCPDCFKGEVHNHGEPKGHEETLYGLPTYISPAPSSSSSTSTILFLTDAFGLKLINNKILADKYAAQTGFRVVMPDIIPGGPMDVSVMNTMETAMKPVEWLDIVGQLQRIASIFSAIFVAAPFMYRASPASAYPKILEYARSLRADLPAGAKLGVAGFCWGGYGSTKLCTDSAVANGSERLIDAQFCAHPSGLSAPQMVVDAVTTFKVPYSMAIGDADFAMGKATVLQTEAALRQKVGEPTTNDYEINIYDGCKHGFAVRAAADDKVGIAGSEKALVQAVEWYKKYL